MWNFLTFCSKLLCTVTFTKREFAAICIEMTVFQSDLKQLHKVQMFVCGPSKKLLFCKPRTPVSLNWYDRLRLSELSNWQFFWGSLTKCESLNFFLSCHLQGESAAVTRWFSRDDNKYSSEKGKGRIQDTGDFTCTQLPIRYPGIPATGQHREVSHISLKLDV